MKEGNYMNGLSISVLVYTVPAVLLALSIHEFSHAYVSYRLGDDEQRQMGRLTLNPLRHLDPIGTLMLLLFGFGWAKPVQVNANSYKDAKSGMVWTAFAGPLSNIFMAFIGTILFYFITSMNVQITYLYTFLSYFISINLGLGLFNLIPIPPLDGSKILWSILPDRVYFSMMKYEQMMAIGLFVLLYTGIFNAPLFAARNALLQVFENFCQLIF